MDRRAMLGAGLTVMIAALAGCGAPAEETDDAAGDADDSEGRDGY
jgi:hypothetical protein